MGLDEESFFKSTLARVIWLENKWSNEELIKAGGRAKENGTSSTMPEQSRTVRSVKEALMYGQQ
ncbi:MAG: hypothetical protein K5795_06215 [Lachnospiraceae bacterium]|nr:hypothetical protein [Lachnospiraceae bacterium]